jgi:hypothetical protein
MYFIFGGGFMKKVMAPCIECFKETGIPNFNFVIQEQNDECVYSFKCDKGHEFILIQQIQRFELKFDMACFSYINDDYSAAVMYCASALERFREFFVQAVWLNNDCEECTSSYEKYWKKVKSRSENQLGTFYAVYFSKFGDLNDAIEHEVKFTQSDVEFRNNVVHKGFYANRERTFAYLEKTYKYISVLLKYLNARYAEGIRKAISYNIETNVNEYKKSCNKKVCSSTITEYHVISLSDLENIENPKPLLDRINTYIDMTNKVNSMITNKPSDFVERIIQHIK